MLSDEEILIKKLSYCEQEYEQNGYLSVGKFEAIKEAINLIEKQSKEIEELKEERKKYPIAMNDEQYKKVIELAQKDIKEELDRQINVRMINEEYIEKNYISKDKIKAKIEELEKIIEFEKPTYEDVLKYAIDILQSLLEKE